MRTSPELSLPPVGEPLEESAPLARRFAAESCAAPSRDGEGCGWIHGLWQYLRLAGLASSPAQHREFYAEALQATGPRPRVMIAGAADYGMLAQVLAAQPGARVTVVDRCETPLALNRWYAERLGAPILTHRIALSELTDEGSFDVVCSHSLLSEIEPAGRVAVLARWAGSLRRGGRALLVNRLRPGSTAAAVGFSASQAAPFREKVKAAVLSLDADWQQIAPDVERYLAARSAYPLCSVAEATHLFESAGLSVVEATEVRPGSESEAGPTSSPGACFVRVVAERRLYKNREVTL